MARSTDDQHRHAWSADLRPIASVEASYRRQVWALQLQVLRELAQHAGHADILGADTRPTGGLTACFDMGSGR